MSDITKTIAGALLIGGSLAVGNPALITAAGGVGVNWTSEGLQGIRRALRTRKLDTPLAKAYAQALKTALARLKNEYAARGGASQGLGAFDLVASYADGFANAEFPPTRLDAGAAQAQLAHGLDALLYGYESHEFIKNHLMQATALALRDELAKDSEAWMRFHGWVLEDLRENQGEMSAKLDHVSEVLDSFADPKAALADMQEGVIRIDITTTRIDKTTQRIEEKLDLALAGQEKSRVVFHNERMQVNGGVFQAETMNFTNNMMPSQNLPKPVDTAHAEKALSAMNNSQLRDWLAKKFTEPDLETLCEDVQTALAEDGIDEQISLDVVGGETLSLHCQNLIKHLERRGYKHYLIQAAAKLRPNA